MRWLILMLVCVAEARAALTPVAVQDVKIEDSFWSPRREIWRRVTIVDCFDKFEKEGAFANFDNVRDGKSGQHKGQPWYDGLVYETITGAAGFLSERRDAELEKRIDAYIVRIAAAAEKDPDGFLNTYTQLKEPNHRWGTNGGNDRWQHDLYNAGCLVEAGVHYYRATGRVELLGVAARLANHMCDVMGAKPRKNVIPGHALPEAALVELCQLFKERPFVKRTMPFEVKEDRYLELAKFWIDARGNHEGRESFGAYNQDHLPVVKQQAIEGHAVRATLLATGVAMAASATNDAEYRAAARRLWENMTGRRMYITGGVGAVADDEKFGADYVLPNNGYLETCASVSGAFFHHRMNLDAGEARYADELERVLYNGVLGGVSLEGNRYFYENPLEAGKNHVRWMWHACPCCPPMFLKAMGALPGYVYATAPEALYVNLYIASAVRVNDISLTQMTRYPWDGNVSLTLKNDATFELNLRVPAWCQADEEADALYRIAGRPKFGAFIVKVNGEVASPAIEKGYAKLKRQWKRGDVVEINMRMPARRVHANEKVDAARGRVALLRGPVVYCLESTDNDGRVRNISLPDDAELRVEERADLLGGVSVIRAKAQAAFAGEDTPRAIEMTAIPYFANANRGPSSRRVWIARNAKDVVPANPAVVDESHQEATIRVDIKQAGKPVTRFMTGACIEDVNHEIYGGIYSQMIFGESFQEPSRSSPVKGFVSPDGVWRVKDGVVEGEAGPGPKLVSERAPFVTAEVGVEVYLPGNGGGNGGLIVRTGRVGAGADAFDGYEIAIDAARKMLVIGRHQRDFRLMREAPCDVAPDRWISLSVKLEERSLEVFLDGKSVTRVEDSRPLPPGGVGLRHWQRQARYRKLWVTTGETREEVALEPNVEKQTVSGMWRAVVTGNAVMEALLEKDKPFTGTHSQRLTFAGGSGSVGIENQGLNRQGMVFVEGKPYDGYLWMRAERPIAVIASLESHDGRVHAKQKIDVTGGDEWRRYEFAMTPDRGEASGRFALRLESPGSVVIGHAFLQPGEWGRFKGLPVRRDVVEGLIDQGITMLRYGGSMVNNDQYRWKKMIGERDRRPPYRGHWYPYSTNGWGIIDFLNLCEAAGFAGIPDFNMDESPRDIADFIDYVNGPAESEWGKKRAADGHPAPYKLKYIQLGNEERVDDAYYAKFEKLATTIWAKDPDMIVIVGDFVYETPIVDPIQISGAASRITNLSAHQKILALAKMHGREVWFDVHLWTEGPRQSTSEQAYESYVNALEKLADGARHRAVVFELNANNHDHRRALANAAAIGRIMRDGRTPVVLSANCLQVDGQNDNGWDQGLLFMNPAKVWLQPPGYVTRMLSRVYQPIVLDAKVEGALDVTATRSEDEKKVVLRVVNVGDHAVSTQLEIEGLAVKKASVEELAAPLRAVNTAVSPANVSPKKRDWDPRTPRYEFPAHSFTIIELE